MGSALEDCLVIPDSLLRVSEWTNQNERRKLVREHMNTTPVINRTAYVEYYPIPHKSLHINRGEVRWQRGLVKPIFAQYSSSKRPLLMSIVINKEPIPLERIKFFGLVK